MQRASDLPPPRELLILLSCLLPRSDPFAVGPLAPNWLGADVALDSRTRAHEHAVHIAGRSGRCSDLLSFAFLPAWTPPLLYYLFCYNWASLCNKDLYCPQLTPVYSAWGFSLLPECPPMHGANYDLSSRTSLMQWLSRARCWYIGFLASGMCSSLTIPVQSSATQKCLISRWVFLLQPSWISSAPLSPLGRVGLHLQPAQTGCWRDL